MPANQKGGRGKGKREKRKEKRGRSLDRIMLSWRDWSHSALLWPLSNMIITGPCCYYYFYFYYYYYISGSSPLGAFH